MKECIFKVIKNDRIAPGVFMMKLAGDASSIINPGQFVNIKLDKFFLRRPISVFDYDMDCFSIIYKTVGDGTEYMSSLPIGSELNILTGLGNGFEMSCSGLSPVVCGGGVGIPPLYALAKRLADKGCSVTAVLGFNRIDEVFCESDFRSICDTVIVTTVDGSYGRAGYAPDVLSELSYTHVFSCGPLPMLKAVFVKSVTDAQLSLEERMGCGFGACMGCSIQTKNGAKRVCREGPVFFKEELIL